MGFAAAQMNLGLAGRFGFGQGLLQPRLRGWFERCNWPRVRTRQSNCPPPSTVWSSWVKAESAVRPWRVACLPCCQRWAMREATAGDVGALGALLEIQAKNTTPDKADVRMKAWLEFVGSGSLKRAYGQDYDRDLEALRKDGASLLEANLELAARYRDKGGKLSAGVASPTLEAYRASRGEFQGLLESQQSSVGSSGAMRSVARGCPRSCGRLPATVGRGADRFGQRPESISGQPGQGERGTRRVDCGAARSLSADDGRSYRRRRCGVIRYLAYKGGAALSTCCVAVGSVGEDRCRRRPDRTGCRPGIGW